MHTIFHMKNVSVFLSTIIIVHKNNNENMDIRLSYHHTSPVIFNH